MTLLNCPLPPERQPETCCHCSQLTHDGCLLKLDPSLAERLGAIRDYDEPETEEN